MRVNEIFTSLQGEGYHTGTVATFVRLSGCNLRCPFCDTDFTHGTEMSEEEIAGQIEMGAMVVLTGGEPGLQVTESLIDRLHERGCYVTIETNGTQPLPQNIDWVTCSPKEGSRPVLGEADEVKVVYTGQDVERWRERIRARHYFLQPCDTTAMEHADGTPTLSDTIGYVMAHPWWRLSLQTHKIIGIQ